MNVLEIKALSKQFGTHEVLQDVQLTIPEHSIYGFLGQNGAGKTTMMKLITGLLKPDKGEITICGEKVIFAHSSTNRHIGYLPDVPAFYTYMKPREYLQLCGEISGLDKQVIKQRSEELLTLVSLDHVNRRMKGFSRGMKQRMGIAQALLHKPKLLICDEPTSALDPVGRKELMDILHRVKDQTTVLFSTHILSDVERICDHVAILHNGYIVIDGQLSTLREHHKHDQLKIEFVQAKQLQQFIALCQSKSWIQHMEQDHLTCILQVSDLQKNKALLLAMLVQERFDIQSFEVMEPSLENLFLEVVQ